MTLDEDEHEEETAAPTTDPECNGGHMTEEDFIEYSAMLDYVTEAALRDGRERTQQLRQRLRNVQERIKRHTDRDRSLHTKNRRITTTVKRTSTTDADRVSSGSVEPDHTRVVYFKEEKAIQDKKGQTRRSREASWDRSMPPRERIRRTSPHGPRDSRQGGSHSYHHLVHYAGVDVDSYGREEDEDDGEEEDGDNDDDDEETYVYSAEEDSEDDMAEPYVTHPYYAEYEARHTSVATIPVTVATTKAAPTTVASTTAAPTPVDPTTAAPTPAGPTTVACTTAAPTPAGPTTACSTPVDPTTAGPTPVDPTTAAPTPAGPTTACSTTARPKGEGNPGTGRGTPVRWSWNGISFERINIAKPVKIFTISRRPNVASVSANWAHINDCPLRSPGQSLVPNPAQSGQDRSEAEGEAIPPVVSVEAPGNAGTNHASNPCGESRTDSSSGMSGASQAGAGEATLGQCAIQQGQKLDATEQGQDSDARKLGQQTCNKAEQEFTQVKVEDEKDRVELGKEVEHVTFFTDDEEYYNALDVEADIHHGGLDQDERYWSSEDEDVDEEQKGENGLDIEEKVKGEEASNEIAEFNAICSLADSLPDTSYEDEDLAKDTRAVEDEATVEEESNVLEGNDSDGKDELVVTPFFTEDEGSLRPYLNLDGHMEFYGEVEKEVGLAVTEHTEEGEVLQQDDFGCLDDSTRGQIGNLDDQRRWSHDNEGEDQEVLDEVGAVDNGASKHVSGGGYSGIIDNVRSDGEVSTSGAKGPDPPYPPDTPSESDCDKEDAGYGSGAEGTILKSERAVTWFPPLTGERSLKRNNQSHFGSGLQEEPPFVTNFTKIRKLQVIESEIVDSPSLLQFTSLALPCGQAPVPEPEVGARPWQWRHRGHYGGGLLASSQELWRPPGMPGTQPRNSPLAGEVSAATHGGRAYWLKFHEGGGRLFTRVDLKLDKSVHEGYTVQEMRQLEELCSEWGNPARPEGQPGDEEEQKAESGRRRSRRLLNRQAVTL